ncbi:MAG: hypothetical protein WC300_05470, partial [Candidatus Omnitrophota bacterium]
MKKNIIRICVSAAAAILLLTTVKLLFNLSRDKRTPGPVQNAYSSAAGESRALKRIRELLASSKKAEAISELESMAASFKGQREGYEAVS